MKNQKKIRSLIIMGVLFIGMGVLLLYRANLKEVDFSKIDGKLTSISIKKHRKLSGGGLNSFNYSIIFKIENKETRYGIYTGTQKQANRKLNKLKAQLKQGEKYSFYIDPTAFKKLNNIQLGVRQIKKGTKTMYKESNKATIGFGKIAIALGVLSILGVLFLYQNFIFTK